MATADPVAAGVVAQRPLDARRVLDVGGRVKAAERASSLVERKGQNTGSEIDEVSVFDLAGTHRSSEYLEVVLAWAA